ncbi:MAG: SprT-like family protein [Deltaproteobacteria bacterium]|nr:SprT-like family protein [Deltaproteobacteria bacterium]
MDLASHIAATGLAADEIASRSGAIRAAVLARSGFVRAPDFLRIGTADLRLLFALYDERFFGGGVGAAVQAVPGTRLTFRLAPRMTNAGGKTYVFKTPGGGPKRYEIAISTHLLFSNFGAGGAPILVNGIECRDRLDALLRIFEHELVHLAELLLFGSSSCKGHRFGEIARRLFGHTEVTHRLPTTRHKAAVELGLRVGDRIAFEFEGRSYTGFVNRITKRASVLVEDPGGMKFSDGKRYLRFYVPLGACRNAGA